MTILNGVKHTIMTQYWGQVITFIVAVSIMFAFIRAVFILLGQ